MEKVLFGLKIEQHQDEEIQNQYGSCVHNDLNGKQEFRIEQDKQARHVQQQRQQTQSAMDRILQCDGEDTSNDTYRRKIPEQ